MRKTNRKSLEHQFDKKFKTYLQSGLWCVFNEFLPFIIERDNGELVYVVVFGMEDYVDACLFIFPDSQSFGTYDHLFTQDQFKNPLKEAERYFSQDALAVLVDHEDYEIKLAPRNYPIDDYPKFKAYRFKPHVQPNDELTNEELELITEVTDKLNKIIHLLKQPNSHEILRNFHTLIEGRGIIPIFHFDGRKIRVNQKVLNYKKKKIKVFEFDNELLIGKLKRIPKYGSCAFEIYYSSVPVYAEQEDKLRFVNGLIYYDYNNDYLEPILIGSDAEKEPEAFVSELIQELTDFEKLPKEVYIRDEKTNALISDFLTKAGIIVHFEPEVEELDLAENEIFNFEFEDYERINDLSLLEVDRALNSYTDVNSPYSKRVRKSLLKLKESIIETFSEEFDVDPEDYNPNFGFETFYFKYIDSLGNNCFAKSPDRISLSDILSGIFKLIDKQPESVEIIEPEGLDIDHSVSFMKLKPGTKIKIKAVKPDFEITLEVAKIISESCDVLQVYSKSE